MKRLLALFAIASAALAQQTTVLYDASTGALARPSAASFRSANGIQTQSANLDAWSLLSPSTWSGSSSITTLGTVTAGTWNGTLLAGQYGGTGVANTGKTITLGGNVTTSGAFPLTLTLTGNTTLTLPTTGTVLSTADFTSSANAQLGSQSTSVVTPETAAGFLTSRALSRWYRNVAYEVSNGTAINIVAGVDSLTAGSAGYSWVQPFRNMVQNALGDGGIGFQQPTISWEFGSSGVNYVGWTADTNDGTTDAKYGAFVTSLSYSGSSNVSAIFNAGTITQINRETDEVDVYYLANSSGASSVRMYGFPSGAAFTVSANNATPLIKKQTLTGFGKPNSWSATYAAIDQQNGPMRILGLNFRRLSVNGGARVHMWARGGTTLQSVAQLDATSQQYYFGQIGSDLVILNAGMNDRTTRTKAQFKADLETLITNVRTANTNAAILLVFPTIPSTGPGNLSLYRDAMLELASQYTCAFVDTAWILGDNDAAVAAGLIDTDHVHPTEQGFRQMAFWLYRYIGGEALSQAKNTVYNQYAPQRDVDAVSVSGWKPGDTVTAASQTFSGNVTINGAAGLRMNNPGTANDYALYLEPSLTAGNTAYINFGVAQSTRNLGAIGFKYVGAGSTSNSLVFALYGGNIGTWDASGNLSANGTIKIGSSPPASATATGTTGTITWDANYVYVCVATNTWKRAAIATW